MPTPLSPSHFIALLIAGLLLAALTSVFTRLDAAVHRVHVRHQTWQRRRRFHDGR